MKLLPQKINPFLFVLILVLPFLQACEKSTFLQVNEAEICLHDNGQKQCVKNNGQLHQLCVQDGKMRIKTVQRLQGKDLSRIQSFKETHTLTAAMVNLKLDKDKIIVANGQEQYATIGKQGFLFEVVKDRFTFAGATDSDTECTRKEIKVTPTGIKRDTMTAHTFFTWESEAVLDEDGNRMFIEKGLQADLYMAHVANDTGIEIIDDIFKMSDCCDSTFLACPPVRGAEINPNLEPTIPPAGWKEDFLLQVGFACVYEVCTHLIVANKITGQIKCYDTEKCDTRLQLNGNGTFSILLPTACNTADAVKVCPPRSTRP